MYGQQHPQSKTSSDSTAISVQPNLGRSRPFSDSPETDEASRQSPQTPDLQTQLNNASHFGHHLSQVNVNTTSQSQQLEGQSQQLAEWEETSKEFSPLNSRLIQRQEQEPIDLSPSPFAVRLQRQVIQSVQSTISSLSSPQIQREPDDTWQEARRRAFEIKDALLDNFTEDEEKALDQIRGQSPLMLKEIRAHYRQITGGNSLEADFKELCDDDEYKEALSLLHVTLSIEDKIRTNIDKGWIFDSENETGMLEVLRRASNPELQELAGDAVALSRVEKLLKGALDDDEYYEARKILTPNKIYEIVIERIRNAKGYINDNEDATYNVLLDLTPAQRKQLWENNQDIFGFMSDGEKDSVRKMCLGTEAEALEERMDLATSGLGTDDDAVKLVVGKTQTAAQAESAIDQALKSGKAPDGTDLTLEQILQLQQQKQQLGGIQDNLLKAERDEDGDLKSGTFLEMLEGDVGDSEFQNFAGTMGVSQFEQAKQQILDAIGWFNDDEDAIYAAFDRIVGSIEIPLGTNASNLTPEQRTALQQQASRRLRQELLNDPAIKKALSHLNDEEMAITETYASADSYEIAIKKLEIAFYGMDTDEEGIFKILCEMNASDRARLQAEKPSIYTKITTSGWLTAEERNLVNIAIDTGKIPTDKALNWALGGSGDGTEDEMLEQIFTAMDDAERYQYRLGYYLFKGGESLAEPDEKEQEQLALEKFKKLYARLDSELGTDDLQKALDQLLGIPTLQELRSQKGRMMAAQIMHHRVGEKGDIREGDDVSSALVDTFSDAGGVSDQAEVQFESAYKLALADGKLTEEEFAALAALDANFAQKYDEYVATVDQVVNIASTVAAIAVGIVVVILSGGTGAPAVAALLSKFGVAATTAQSVAAAAAIAGTASATAKVGVSELVGGSHYDAASTEGLKDAAVGFTEGAMTVLSAGLAHRFVNMVGLGKAELAGEMTASILASSDAAVNYAGKTLARAGLEGAIDGFLSGAVGELVMTATDANVWKKSIWDVVLSFGEAILKGGGIGAITGAVMSGSVEALTTYVGVKRVQGLMRQLNDVGIDQKRLDELSIDTVKGLGQVDAALSQGKLDEAEAALQALEGKLTPAELASLRSSLRFAHSKVIGDAVTDGLKKALAGEGDVAQSAIAVLETYKDFGKLRQMASSGAFGDAVAAGKALDAARQSVLEDVKTKITAQLQQKYPGATIEFSNLGSPGFGSDCDITVKVTGGKNVNEDVAASIEGVRDSYAELRRRGFEPDRALDTNYYTELHEGSIIPTDAAQESAIRSDQSVVSMAEMRLNMTDDQWKAYKEAQLAEPEQLGDAGIAEQIEAAEAMAGRLKNETLSKEEILAAKQQELLAALSANESPQKIRLLMAELKLLEPDAYGPRAAVTSVVDYQQKMAKSSGEEAFNLFNNRSLPDDLGDRYAVLAQDASANLGKLFGHSKPSGNSLKDVRTAAKYLGRIEHALMEAGAEAQDRLLNIKNLIMAAKRGDAPDDDTLKALQAWAEQSGVTYKNAEELCDAWIKEAQSFGQDSVVWLRNSERFEYSFNPSFSRATPEQLENIPALQKQLFEDAKQVRQRQQAFADQLLSDLNIPDGTAKSILKRDSFDDFIKGVLEKCKRKEYTHISQMDDIVRGRFNLPDEESVGRVVKAIEEKAEVVSIVAPRRPQPGGGFGYPRYHIIVRDPATGMTHEWQIGTTAVTKLYETPGIKIPEALQPGFRIKSDLHDIEYDIFKGIQDKHPELASSLGIPQFRDKVDQASAIAGKGTMPDLAKLHEEASHILQKLVDQEGVKFVEQFYH